MHLRSIIRMYYLSISHGHGGDWQAGTKTCSALKHTGPSTVLTLLVRVFCPPPPPKPCRGTAVILIEPHLLPNPSTVKPFTIC